MSTPADSFRQRARRLLQSWQAEIERNPEYGQFVSSYTPDDSDEPEDRKRWAEDEITEGGRWIKMG